MPQGSGGQESGATWSNAAKNLPGWSYLADDGGVPEGRGRASEQYVMPWPSVSRTAIAPCDGAPRVYPHAALPPRIDILCPLTQTFHTGAPPKKIYRNSVAENATYLHRSAGKGIVTISPLPAAL